MRATAEFTSPSPDVLSIVEQHEKKMKAAKEAK
jgi:hypothetical protein